jgi:hypothetical protein
MSLASRRWGRAEKRGQILADDPPFVKGFRAIGFYLTNRLLAVEDAPFLAE